MKKLNYFILTLLFIFSLYACEKDLETYIVSFDSNGGSTISEMIVEKSQSFLPNEVPSKEGYIFAGWYIDSNLLYPMSFHMGIQSNITLYAKWILDVTPLEIEDVEVLLDQYLLEDLEKYLNEETIVSLFESHITKTIEKASRSVVMINTYRSGQIESGGSGVIYKKVNQTYYVLTNEHVVDGYTSSNVEIVIFDGNEEITIPRGQVTIRKKSVANDMAVVTFSHQRSFEIMPFGSASELKSGQMVFAIGSPLDLPNTVTMGVISYFDRPMAYDLTDTITIQHTASINPGNSGGALINIYGQLIGLNFMSYVDPEYGLEGLHFAIQIDRIMSIISSLE